MTDISVPTLPSTPINIDALEEELRSHPNRDFVSTLITNLRDGFRVGYFGPEFSFECPNLKSVEEYPDVMAAYLEKKVKLGHISGPYLTCLSLTFNVTLSVWFLRRLPENGGQSFICHILPGGQSMISLTKTLTHYSMLL